jgi:hypothetical protein
MLVVPENFVNALLSEVLGTVNPPTTTNTEVGAAKKKVAKKPGFPEADTNKKFDAEDSAREPERTVKPIYDDDDNSAPSVQTKPVKKFESSESAVETELSKRDFEDREKSGGGTDDDRFAKWHEDEAPGSTTVINTPGERRESKTERHDRIFGASKPKVQFTPEQERANVETRKLSKIRQRRSYYDRLKSNQLEKHEGRWSDPFDARELGDRFKYKQRRTPDLQGGEYIIGSERARERDKNNRWNRRTVPTYGRTSRVINPVEPRREVPANSRNTIPNARRSDPNPRDIIPNVTGREKKGPWARTQAINASLDLARTLRLKVLNENK